jgi:cell volume regulation protein A
MVHPFLTGWSAARRRGGDVRGPTRQPNSSTTRLVALELGWVAGRIAHPSRSVPAIVAGAIVALLLAPATPGPVIGGWARTAAAVVVAVLAAVLGHSLLQRASGPHSNRTTVVLVGCATVALLGSASTVVAYVLAAMLGTQVSADATIDAGLAVDSSVAIGAALLLGGVFVARLSDRLQVPGALALLGLGMAVGSDGLGLIVVNDTQWVQGVAVIALIIILYHGGLTTRPRTLRGAVAPGVVLATVGVAITALIVALVGVYVLDLPTGLAWLIAAVVSSTDAAAVLAVLRQTPLGPRLAGVLQVESGANDPVAVLLTIAFLSSADVANVGAGAAAGAGGASLAVWLGFGLAQIGLGVVLGVGIGLVGAAGLARLSAHPLLPTAALAVGGVAYGATALAGGSGFLAVYLCGITVAARTPGARRAMRAFHGALAGSVEVGLFLLLGLLVIPAGLPDVLWTGVLIALALTLVARPLATTLSLAPFGFRPAEVAAISWLGMRGAVPIVLATVAFSAGHPDAAVLLDIVLVVVLISTLLQGLTSRSVVRRLGLATAPTPHETLVDVQPFEGFDGLVLEVTLGDECRLAGKRLSEVPPPAGALVTAIVRNSRLIVGRGDTVLCTGDHLLVAVDRTGAEPEVRAWVGDTAPDARNV